MPVNSYVDILTNMSGVVENNNGGGEDAGHVRVYKYSDGDWVQLGSDIDGEAASDQSGFSVSLSSDGTIVAIGANGNDGLVGLPTCAAICSRLSLFNNSFSLFLRLPSIIYSGPST